MLVKRDCVHTSLQNRLLKVNRKITMHALKIMKYSFQNNSNAVKKKMILLLSFVPLRKTKLRWLVAHGFTVLLQVKLHNLCQTQAKKTKSWFNCNQATDLSKNFTYRSCTQLQTKILIRTNLYIELFDTNMSNKFKNWWSCK